MSTERESLRVFVSYARSDASEFAEELVTGLEVAGFEGFLDRHDIAGGEDWETRLGGLIASADTLVFVITPGSVASPRCKWEIHRAESLSKRILPIVRIDVDESHTPEQLRRLNYIFFREGQPFSRALGDLAKALRTDLSWIREHTRLGDLARRWQEKGTNQALLLRGPELQSALEWRARWRAPAPEPTELHRDYINASETAEGLLLKRERSRQRRLVFALSAAVLLFGTLAAISYGYSQKYLSARIAAETEKEKADQSALEAQLSEAKAIDARHAAEDAKTKAEFSAQQAQQSEMQALTARKIAEEQKKRADSGALAAKESEANAIAARKVAEDEKLRADSSALEARKTAAKALFYEGLYWFRSAEANGAGAERQSNYAKSLHRFEGGLQQLGDADLALSADGDLASLGQVSLKELLTFGRRYVITCTLKRNPTPEEHSPVDVREFFVKSLNVPTFCGGAAH